MKTNRRFNDLVSQERRILAEIADLKHPDERLAEVKAAYEADKREDEDRAIECQARLEAIQAGLSKPWDQYHAKSKGQKWRNDYVVYGYTNKQADECYRLSCEINRIGSDRASSDADYQDAIYRYENWSDFMNKAENELFAVRQELKFVCEKALKNEIKAELVAERKAVKEPVNHVLMGQNINGCLELNVEHLRAIAGNCVKGCLIVLQTGAETLTYPLHKSILTPILREAGQNLTVELSDKGLRFKWTAGHFGDHRGYITLKSRDYSFHDKKDLECCDLCFEFAL